MVYISRLSKKIIFYSTRFKNISQVIHTKLISQRAFSNSICQMKNNLFHCLTVTMLYIRIYNTAWEYVDSTVHTRRILQVDKCTNVNTQPHKHTCVCVWVCVCVQQTYTCTHTHTHTHTYVWGYGTKKIKMSPILSSRQPANDHHHSHPQSFPIWICAHAHTDAHQRSTCERDNVRARYARALFSFPEVLPIFSTCIWGEKKQSLLAGAFVCACVCVCVRRTCAMLAKLTH